MHIVPTLEAARNLDNRQRSKLAEFVIRWSPLNQHGAKLFHAELEAAIRERLNGK